MHSTIISYELQPCLSGERRLQSQGVFLGLHAPPGPHRRAAAHPPGREQHIRRGLRARTQGAGQCAPGGKQSLSSCVASWTLLRRNRKNFSADGIFES